MKFNPTQGQNAWKYTWKKEWRKVKGKEGTYVIKYKNGKGETIVNTTNNNKKCPIISSRRIGINCEATKGLTKIESIHGDIQRIYSQIYFLEEFFNKSQSSRFYMSLRRNFYVMVHSKRIMNE